MHAALQRDADGYGFEWIEHSDAYNSIFSFIRHGGEGSHPVVVICNFTPTVHRGYRLGVPRAGSYVERINTDSAHYGGSNVGTPFASSHEVPWQQRLDSILIDVPPLATVIFEWQP